MCGSRLCVLVPTKGRPANVARLTELWAATKPSMAQLLFLLDSDDVVLSETMDCLVTLDIDANIGWRIRESMGGMGPTLNHHAAVEAPIAEYLGFMGDDHLPRTPGWDERIVATLDEVGGTGIVYCNDLFQRQNLPTAVFLSTEMVQTLGYMAPPELIHLFMDNVWLDWGRQLNRLRYLDDVVIEHVHPTAGKASFDERYAAVNSSERWIADHEAFEAYRRDRLGADVRKLKSLMAPTAVPV